MQPHDWAAHIEQSAVQTIPLPQVDGSHPGSSTSIVTLIVLLDCLLPETSDVRGAVFAETNVNQEVAVVVVGFEGRSGIIRCPLINWPSTGVHSIPAAELACTLRLVVHGGAERDNPSDLRGSSAQ